ncbi:hypothetical protein [Streptomyces sp. NBC_00582]|uniref:hypothetical protein n=1 Tax=Streptomyces sp. NBC_00582 TaxID=2975783 RepID=UPI002E80A789|nr:hypothetical protein [Streptomyces sp. NBC_00582]WUB64421.1 hypothetical protein OG852_30535 [Streptomyces sp. NBC_00582]
MANSKVPAAIANLLAILRARPALQQGLLILDGPAVVDVSQADLISVGWSPDGDQAVELVQDFNAAGARTRNEQFAIHCVIDVWNGGNDIAAVRVRVFEIFAEIENALRASDLTPDAPTLNNTVLWAHLTSGVLRQSFTEQGARVALSFTVTCQARI